jgi:hypothetical protein
VNVCVVNPLVFVAVIVKVYTPCVPAPGVPERTPVAALNVTPVGRCPDSENVGAGLPEAVTWKLKKCPWVTFVELSLVKTG